MSVHIVESVQPGEGSMLSQSLRLAGIHSTYASATGADDFQRALRGVRSLSASQPYVGLHISSHGSKSGLNLMSGEAVTWYELQRMLLPLNHKSGGRLVVTLSTCYGLFGTGMALELSATPFRMLVGPVGKVTFSDAAVAFIVFYHQIRKGTAFDAALELMKSASGEHRFGIVDGEATRQGLLDHLRAHGITELDE